MFPTLTQQILYKVNAYNELTQYVSRKLGQGGEYTFIRKTLKNPHLSISNLEYYLHIARLNSAQAY